MDRCKECGKGTTELERLVIRTGECMSCHLIENTPKPISERPRVEARQSIMYHTKKMYQGGNYGTSN